MPLSQLKTDFSPKAPQLRLQSGGWEAHAF